MHVWALLAGVAIENTWKDSSNKPFSESILFARATGKSKKKKIAQEIFCSRWFHLVEEFPRQYHYYCSNRSDHKLHSKDLRPRISKPNQLLNSNGEHSDMTIIWVYFVFNRLLDTERRLRAIETQRANGNIFNIIILIFMRFSACAEL